MLIQICSQKRKGFVQNSATKFNNTGLYPNFSAKKENRLNCYQSLLFSGTPDIKKVSHSIICIPIPAFSLGIVANDHNKN